MKNLILALCLILLASTATYAQYNTGDSQLNVTLAKIDGDAKLNFSIFKSDISAQYSVAEKKIDSWFVEFGMKGGEIYLVVQIAKITKRPVDDVVKVYQANKTKGWGAIAKELGIKPGSAEFHALKNGAGAHASNAHGKGRGKGKGK